MTYTEDNYRTACSIIKDMCEALNIANYSTENSVIRKTLREMSSDECNNKLEDIIPPEQKEQVVTDAHIIANEMITARYAYEAEYDIDYDNDFAVDTSYTEVPVPVWVVPQQAENFNHEGNLESQNLNRLIETIYNDDDVSPHNVTSHSPVLPTLLDHSHINLPHVVTYLREQGSMNVSLLPGEKAFIEEIGGHYCTDLVYYTLMSYVSIDTLMQFAHNVATAPTFDALMRCTLRVPAATPWGIFDAALGGGSLMNCHLADPLELTIFDLIGFYGQGIFVDHDEYKNYGYCPREVYGDHIASDPTNAMTTE